MKRQPVVLIAAGLLLVLPLLHGAPASADPVEQAERVDEQAPTAAAVGSEVTVAPQINAGTNVPRPNPYPWMTALLLARESNPYDAQFCGGALVAPAWVLTAAHCIEGMTSGEIQVAPNVLNLSGISARQSVAQIVIHPNRNRATKAYDFALLRLSTPSRNAALPVVPLVLQGQSLSAGTNATIMGWGKDYYACSPSCYPDRLQWAQVQIRAGNTSSTCDSYLSSSSYRPESMLCAGGEIEPFTDSCSGDSGGPLLVNLNGQLLLAGIVSWGRGTSTQSCGLAGYPGIYGRVSSSAGWITTIISRFVDVPVYSWFDVPAHEMRFLGITEGTPSSSEFSPGMVVTRSQMAAFLWRLAGSRPSSSSCGFADEAAIPVFARPGACWLKTVGVTTSNPFNPSQPVSRAQMAAFLWRMNGQEWMGSSCGFADEAAIPVFARPGACWLKEMGITTSNPFNPSQPVSRAQMAVFLYRYLLMF